MAHATIRWTTIIERHYTAVLDLDDPEDAALQARLKAGDEVDDALSDLEVDQHDYSEFTVSRTLDEGS